jgi:hypothetical protein
MLSAAPLQQAADNMCAPIFCGPLQSITKLVVARGVLKSAQQLVTNIPQLVLDPMLQGSLMLGQ